MVAPGYHSEDFHTAGNIINSGPEQSKIAEFSSISNLLASLLNPLVGFVCRLKPVLVSLAQFSFCYVDLYRGRWSVVKLVDQTFTSIN